MQPVLFTTADYASVSTDGKLTIAGIFDSIQAAEFPANSVRMMLVAQFRAQPDEYENAYQLNFQLRDPDGKALFHLTTAGEVPYSDHDLPVLLNQVVTLNNVQFEKPGSYEFAAIIDDRDVAVLPFHVVKMRKPSNSVR